MKLGSYFLLGLLLAVALYLMRQRLKLALRLGAGLYVIVVAVRFVQVRDDTERLLWMALTIGAFAAVWGLVWLLARVFSKSEP